MSDTQAKMQNSFNDYFTNAPKDLILKIER